MAVKVFCDPKKLGRFEIRSRLGAGSFGVVYRAYDPMLDRNVALKVPHLTTLQSDEAKARFLREPKIAGRLRHPNIVPVYEAGADGVVYYMASAFIEGQTLRDVIDREPFDPQGAATLVLELADALDYAHRVGIVHRDVRPANIMLDSAGRPLLTDFGLARFLESQETLTHDGTLLGTPAYMSPEQAAGQREKVGPHSDQYSLGVVLYELLCGRTPYRGSAASVMAEVLRGQPPHPRSIDRKIPWELEAICLKAISKEPRHRYGRCRELGDDLRRWQARELVHAADVGPLDVIWSWCRRNPGMATRAAMVVLLLVIVAIVVNIANVWSSHALATAEQALATAEDQRQRADDNLAEIDREEEVIRELQESIERDTEQTEALRKELDAAVQRRKDALTLGELAENLSRRVEELQSEVARLNLLRKPVEQELANVESKLTDTEGIVKRVRAELRSTLEGLLHESLTLTGHANRVTSVAFGPEGWRIVSGSGDTTVKVWDAVGSRELRTFRGHTDCVNSVAFSPDGRRIASGSGDSTIKVWNATSGQQLRTLEGHRDCVNSVGFSPDGRRIVSGSSDNTIKTWDTTSGRLLFTFRWQRYAAADVIGGEAFEEYANGVNSVGFSPDGRWIVSGSSDNTVKIWDAMNGRELRTLRGQREKVLEAIDDEVFQEYPSGVNSVAFGPFGWRIVGGSGDGTLEVWFASPEE